MFSPIFRNNLTVYTALVQCTDLLLTGDTVEMELLRWWVREDNSRTHHLSSKILGFSFNSEGKTSFPLSFPEDLKLIRPTMKSK
jgi:hypothetical protein